MNDQRPYWDRVAAIKTFTHPLDQGWLRTCIGKHARILDFGCGYGRTLQQLRLLGYCNAVGVDFAPRMIERGLHDFPMLDLRVVAALPLAEAAASFDAILLFAVLTCIPDDHEQDRLMAELRRLLRPGGVLYISDMPLQSDARNLARYAAGKQRFGTCGVFQTDDGAIVRHHDDRRLAQLLAGFEPVMVQPIRLHTMHGHAAVARQILARRQLGLASLAAASRQAKKGRRGWPHRPKWSRLPRHRGGNRPRQGHRAIAPHFAA